MRLTGTRRHPSSRGFTLVELMIVVVIVSILATVAVYGVSKYIASSKTGEAVQMIGSIKAAQESFKDETFQYVDVSPNLTSANSYYPTNSKPGETKVMWGGASASSGVDANWRMLGVNASGPVRFVYACVAGDRSVADSPGMGATVGNWPSDAQPGPWYVVQAYADLNGDGGATTSFIGASFTTEIFSANEGE